MDDHKYNVIARNVNRRVTRVIKGIRVLNFTTRPYDDSLASDGIHFNRLGRQHVAEKISNAIKHAVNQ